MKEFLTHIVDHIDAENLAELRNTSFVFPSKRAGFHFRSALLERFSCETFWLPSIISIEDFIVKCTGKVVSSEIDLLFSLYEAYSTTYMPPPEGEVDKEELPTFDRFYSWGQVLLKDFDEADRYLVKTNELYQNLQQMQELENRYQDSEEILFALKRFNEMIGGDPTSLTVSFSNQWTRVSKTYKLFKSGLVSEGLYYVGMLYRELAEKLQNDSIELPFSKIVFAGFNALSTSEEVIFNRLLEKGVAQIFWDADQLYLNNDLEEAGKFMRRNYRKWPPSDDVHWIITNMLKSEKSIQLIGGVQKVGQSQVVGQLLDQLSEQEQSKCGVVLSDESLLFPMLYALPNSIKSLNVTMGYPAKHSHWYRLAVAYMEYHLHTRRKGNSAFAETQYILPLLNNPLLQKSVPSVRSQVKSLNPKSRWVLLSAICTDDSPDILRAALTPQGRVLALINSLVEMIMLVFQKLRLDNELQQLDTEFAYHSLKHLMQLEERIRRLHQQLEPATLSRLVLQTLDQVNIPFSGEPAAGLQLMGFLETRALDFEKVILVSANEGKLPKGNRHQSYVPYAVRKAFGLPTYEEQDAVYAYHFKRVLQRAKEISIVYDTEVAIDGSGEKSRFIWQLVNSFPGKNIGHQIYQMPLKKAQSSSVLRIPKSASVMVLLSKFLLGTTEGKTLSPTAIRHYLDCSLRFYFRYLVKLREREKLSSELDNRDFGNIVHETFETLYQPLAGESISQDMVKDLLNSNKISEAVAKTIRYHTGKSQNTSLEGKDLLHEQVIQKLIYKAVEKDQLTTPFKLVGTEMKVSADLQFAKGKAVKLEGTLDRVHQINEVIHILDYKTGRADILSQGFRNDISGYLNVHFEEPKYKSGFQSFFLRLSLD